ncbi:sensor histidine kinase [Actinomadura fibrosa]|uniref:histidine kinase n=1 Tax=Actinomadura fibrosa TaxID=111802 RepID=A0ABW2XFI0_9ACTN|nr:nitrate- and nitrite sensing domain-containing protein [Actinomadura fibrosa]
MATGGRRRRPIRLRITALLLVPLISLITLWAFAANITLGAAFDKYDFSTTYEKMGLPGIYLVGQLQAERSLSVAALARRTPQDKQKLGVQRARVNAVQGAFRKTALSSDARDAAKPETEKRLAKAITSLNRLPQLRSEVDSGRAEPLQVIDSYSTVLDDVIAVFNGLVTVNDLAIFEQGRALIQIGNARAYMLREDALVTAALARGGRLSPAEHLAFVQWAANGRQEFEAGMADLNDTIRGPLQQLASSDGFQRYRAAETAIVNARGDRLPAETGDWSATTTLLSQAWEQRVTQASLALNELAKPIGDRVVQRLVLVGGFGLLAVVASIALSLLAGRSLSRELRELQRAALNLAEDRLPGVVARLRRGEEVDVKAEAPPLDIGKSREVARVGDAFTKVQYTAIDTAVRESYLRQGISRVFLNVAWRSQSLLHRQLRMLDEMERKASDPNALEDLFRLDHLTTRMRRHAEGLVILSGTSPGRGWSRPVHVEDVLRAAVSEVEDYTRVEVVVVSGQAAVIGETVADVIHLLAELIENATVFSPAPTEVLVRGEMGANGFAVDIIDRGIGLDQSELDALNLRLSRPPEFDLAVTDRLGLFVVARLAGRHGIKVALQPSLYGGVSAVVLIPRELIVDIDQPEDEVPAGAASREPGKAGAAPAARAVPTEHFEAGTVAGNGSGKLWPNPTAMLNAPTVYDVAEPTTNGTGGYNAPSSETPVSGIPVTGTPVSGTPVADPGVEHGPGRDVSDAPPPDSTVSFDTPASFDDPQSYDAPSYDTPQSYENQTYENQPYEAQSYEGRSYEGQPPHDDAQAFDKALRYESPPSYDAPSAHQQQAYQQQAYGSPPAQQSPSAYNPPPAFDATRPFQAAGHSGAPSSFGDTGFGDAPAPAGPGGRAPLPRRVRRASMAPQLRDDETPPATPYPEDALVAWEERSAEASRDLFASLQAGWLRGRNEDEGPAEGMGGRS